MSKSSFIPTVRPVTDFSPWSDPGIWQVESFSPLLAVGLQFYGEGRENGRGAPKRDVFFGGKECLIVHDRDVFDLEALRYKAKKLLFSLEKEEVPLTRQKLCKANILKVGSGNNINISWLCHYSYWVHHYDKLYQRGISRGDALFILSGLDELLIVGEEDPYLPELLRWLSESNHVADSLPMVPLVMRQGRFQEWNPVPAHPAWRNFKKLRAQEYYRAYKKQFKLLREKQPQLPLAQASIADNRGQKCLFTLVPGHIRTEVSLPFVDAVVFDLEESGKSIIPMQDIFQQWPEGIAATSLKPPRVILRGLPPLHILDRYMR